MLNRFNAPVRCVLSRKEQMLVCGGRHPMMFTYKAGCTAEGRLLALDMKVYADGGYANAMSWVVSNV